MDYSKWQDSLASIYHSSDITREYKSAWQELLASIFNSSAITCEQCTSRVTWAQHASYLQIFSRHEKLLAFFVNLDVTKVSIRDNVLCMSICQTDSVFARENDLHCSNYSTYVHVIFSMLLLPPGTITTFCRITTILFGNYEIILSNM